MRLDVGLVRHGEKVSLDSLLRLAPMIVGYRSLRWGLGPVPRPG